MASGNHHTMLSNALAAVRSLVLASMVFGAATAAALADGAKMPAAANTAAPVEQSASLSAGDDPVVSREYLIKAALLYNFAKFVEWPTGAFDGATTPLQICILGDDPFGAALDTLVGKQVHERPLAIARMRALGETGRCHILFVSASEAARLTEILDYVGGRPILTVADFNRFAQAGGIIGLKTVDNHSRIEVNIDAINRAGLKLSSKLLRLADTVGARAAQMASTPR